MRHLIDLYGVTMPPAEPITGNRLLARLRPDALDALMPSLSHRDMDAGDELAAPWATVTELVFPVSSLASVVSETAEGQSVEVSTIGPEGLVGASAFLASGGVPMRTMVQIGGGAYVGRVADLLPEGGESPLRSLVLRYAQTMLVQASVTASCNRLHQIEQRAARWLLTTSDRLGRDDFPLTHEFFAVLLGAHRPSVSLAAQMLQKGGLISYHRGHLEITDRPGLIGAACECYGIINEHFEGTMGYPLDG